jgi:hypothetical protein
MDPAAIEIMTTFVYVLHNSNQSLFSLGWLEAKQMAT